MYEKAINKTWYENEGAGYSIESVNYGSNCFAAEGDEFTIEFVYPPDPNYPEAVLLKYKTIVSGTPKYYEQFWANACSASNTNRAQYDSNLGVIAGKGTVTLPGGRAETRSFSIALDRSSVTKAFRIHVYVSVPDGGGSQPDDGSWTGNGK